MSTELYMSSDEPLVVVESTQEREPTAAITATETLPPMERTSPSSPGQDSSRLGGALRAEKSRLQWARWRGRVKVALAAIVVVVLVGAAVLVGRRYLPALLAKLTAPPRPPTAIMKNQEKPVPAPAPPPPAKPVKKKPGRKAKATSASTPAAAEEPARSAPPVAPGDAPLPPSDTQ